MNDDGPLASFDDVRAVLAEVPGPDQEAATAAAAREGQLTKPAGALGRLEELAAWLAAWQGRHPPRVARSQNAVFAGNNGVAAQGVSAYPAEVTKQMVANFLAGGAAVNQLCKVADSGLRVYEMDLEQPSEDFSQAPAMDEAGCAGAIAYGMMAVEDGLDVIALGEMGIANTTSAAALCQALYGGSAADWVGRGTGVDDAGLDRKTQVIEAAVAKHRAAMTDPLQVLRHLGGFELAAILGAVLAARMARTPVLLDGYTCTAAAAVLHALDRHALDHCQVARRRGLLLQVGE